MKRLDGVMVHILFERLDLYDLSAYRPRLFCSAVIWCEMVSCQIKC